MDTSIATAAGKSAHGKSGRGRGRPVNRADPQHVVRVVNALGLVQEVRLLPTQRRRGAGPVVDGPPPTQAALAVALAYFAAGNPVQTPPDASPQAKAGAGRDLRLSRAIDAALRQAGHAPAPPDDVSVPPLPPRLRPPELAAEWLREMLAESQRLGISPAEVNAATIATAIVRARRHSTGEAVKSEMRAAVRHLERLEQDHREHPDAYALDALDWPAEPAPTAPELGDVERLEHIHAVYSARLREVSGSASWTVRRPRPGETPAEYGQVCRRVVERVSIITGVVACQP